MSRTPSVLLLFLAVGLDAADGTSDCAAMSEQDAAKLKSYVRGRYGIPATSALSVREVSRAEGSCYRKLEFSADNARPFRIDLYASPDFRFLAPDLMDSHAAPVPAARATAAPLTSALPEQGAAFLGPKGAPVTLAVFSDFQCPFCAQLAAGLKQDIVPVVGDSVRVAFYNFPLRMHPWARAAAEAAACARAQGDSYFWAIHDYIFDHRRDLTAENLDERLTQRAAAISGLDATRFQSCVDRGEMAATVEEHVALGRKLGITGTPTMFINGIRVTGYRPAQILTLIQEQASKAKASK